MLDWYATPFSFDDMVFWSGKASGVPFESAMARVDTIITGPHAGAAFPNELKPFVCPSLTRRMQYDFSDVATGPIGQEWAHLDANVVFVQNCAARVVTDANRAPNSDDLEADLREFFRRWHAGEPVTGVDAVRPVTFGGIPVLREPQSLSEWVDLVAALRVARAGGPQAYSDALARVVETVLGARTDSYGAPITLLCLHDTDAFKCAPDGSLTIERPTAGRMPSLVCLGNCGDAAGEAKPGGRAVTMPPDELRRLARVWAATFGVADADAGPCTCESPADCAVSLNRPYAGGHELQDWTDRLADFGVAVEAFQVEFNRSVLLGPAADAVLRLPGEDWPPHDAAHAKHIAQKLRAATEEARAPARSKLRECDASAWDQSRGHFLANGRRAAYCPHTLAPGQPRARAALLPPPCTAA